MGALKMVGRILVLLLDDLLFIGGCALICVASFLIGRIIGLYVTGAVLCLLGCLAGRATRGGAGYVPRTRDKQSDQKRG